MNRDKTIAVVGAGVIGSSWVALLVYYGYKVKIVDPSSDATDRLSTYVRKALKTQEEIYGECSEKGSYLISRDLQSALESAHFVIESGPEPLETKQDLISVIDSLLGPEIVIASSTTSHIPSDLQTRCRYPERVLVAHPFNPPHLIPLVELVPSPRTSADSISVAQCFLEGLGKTTILLRKEMIGHVANRLTAALYQEAVHLVAEGVVDVQEIDRAIVHGPGLRWAVMGPHLLYHLSGGEGGMSYYLEHLGPTQERRWADLGHPKLTLDVRNALIEGVADEADGRSISEIERQRDDALQRILKALKPLNL